MLKNLLSSIIILSGIWILTSFHPEYKKPFNPTGTYEYNHGENGDGIVKVQKLSENRIKVSIFVVGGPPSHNMGEFMSEVKIKNGVAYYKSGDCGIKFVFNSKAVKVIQTDWNCGFGAGIAADGYYLKTSSAVPDMENAY
ncbi:MAG: hypothetical protein ACO29U_08205 [Crocinitomicaceae bacterium]